MGKVWLAAAAALAAACGATAQEAPRREVLPDTVVPLHYELVMHPDQQALSYTAEVAIDIEARTAVPAIVLNARDMIFTDVRLEDGRAGQASFDAKLERASLSFPGGVAAGRHRLSIAYRGQLRRDTYGFFAMDYATPQGSKRMLATNTEPAAERSFMPSWDEPAQKATFTVSIDAPAGQSAFGNMPVARETPLPNGARRVQFATTPKMSTYLLFFTVGDYERISQKVDGVDFGVVVQRGQTERGRYALAEGVKLLHFYNDYFGVKFPLPKLDLIAAPGTIKGSSMENWGANFYGQADLLFDPKTSSESDRQQVFQVVAHEMAHQWFGDLVTMAWWDNLWLNEGFARWMQTHAAVALHPDWKTDVQALAIHERGMNLDAGAATHPVEQPVASTDEALGAFDNITYDKGAAVITMLEDYVGPQTFRAGVRRYMAAHAFGNTRSDDLWSALQAASGKPVQDIALAFTRRAGLPLIVVTPEESSPGRRVSLVQDIFVSDHRAGQRSEPVATWPIPLTLKSLDEPAKTILLTQLRGEVQATGAAPILVNFGRTSYARVLYAPQLFMGVAQRMKDIPAADQIGLIYDSWALGRAEYGPLTDTLTLIAALPVDADPLVWSRAIDEISAFDVALDGSPQQPFYRRWARGRLAPLAAQVGWRGKAKESAAVALLREPLFKILGRFGDPAVLAEARRIERAPKGTEKGDLVSLARTIVGASASAAEFDRLAGELKAAPDALTRQDILFAMAGATDPDLAVRALDIASGPDAPTGSIQSVAGIVGANHPSLVWRYVMAHLDDPGFAVDPVTRVRMASNMVGRSADPADAAALREAARTRFPASSARNVAGALANNDLNARVHARANREFEAWLASAR